MKYACKHKHKVTVLYLLHLLKHTFTWEVRPNMSKKEISVKCGAEMKGTATVWPIYRCICMCVYKQFGCLPSVGTATPNKEYWRDNGERLYKSMI